MRLYSTPESASKGEVTVLAICETVFCVVLYVVVESVWHPGLLPWAIMIAPLFLASTNLSRGVGLRWYKYMHVFISYNKITIILNRILLKLRTRDESGFGLITILFMAILLVPMFLVNLIGGMMIRTGSTVILAMRHPLLTLANVPNNWRRQVLATDLAHPPELVPGEALDTEVGINFAGLIGLARLVLEQRKLVRGSFVLVSFPLLLLAGFLPSLLYRVSFKATSLVYAPFVWIAHTTISNPLQLKDRLERITKGELEKVRRGYSWLLLTFLAAKIALFFHFVDFAWVVGWLKLPNPQLAEAVLQPGSWPWWQFALGADALLTFGLFYFADAAIPRIEEKQVWNDGWVGNTVSSVSFVRATLAFLVMVHGFLFAWQRVDLSKVFGFFSA